MARKRATGDTQDKLNRVTEEYEKARKSAGTEENNFDDAVSGRAGGELSNFIEDLDAPKLESKALGHKYDRDKIVNSDQLMNARVYRANKKLKKAESE